MDLVKTLGHAANCPVAPDDLAARAQTLSLLDPQLDSVSPPAAEQSGDPTSPRSQPEDSQDAGVPSPRLDVSETETGVLPSEQNVSGVKSATGHDPSLSGKSNAVGQVKKDGFKGGKNSPRQPNNRHLFYVSSLRKLVNCISLLRISPSTYRSYALKLNFDFCFIFKICFIFSENFLEIWSST